MKKVVPIFAENLDQVDSEMDALSTRAFFIAKRRGIYTKAQLIDSFKKSAFPSHGIGKKTREEFESFVGFELYDTGKYLKAADENMCLSDDGVAATYQNRLNDFKEHLKRLDTKWGWTPTPQTMIRMMLEEFYETFPELKD